MYIIYTISCGTMVKHPPLHSLMTSLNKIMTSKLCAVSSSILKYRKCQISTDHFSVYRKQKYIITDKKHVMKNGKKDRPHRPLAFCNSQNRPNWLSGTQIQEIGPMGPLALWHARNRPHRPHGTMWHTAPIGHRALKDTRIRPHKPPVTLTRTKGARSAPLHSVTHKIGPIGPRALKDTGNRPHKPPGTLTRTK